MAGRVGTRRQRVTVAVVDVHQILTEHDAEARKQARRTRTHANGCKRTRTHPPENAGCSAADELELRLVIVPDVHAL
jgi:hypothetical protein